MALKVGDKAPDFSLPSTEREVFSLSNTQKGKACILYFYPADFTPMCTAQACEFSTHFADFEGIGIDVIGISHDSVATHHAFKERYGLQFELLSDEKEEVIKLYHAKLPIFGMTKRITYLLDDQHIIRKIYTNMISGKAHIRAMRKNNRR